MDAPSGAKAKPVPHHPYSPPKEVSSTCVVVNTVSRLRVFLFSASSQFSSQRSLFACQTGARVIFSAVEYATVRGWAGDHSAYSVLLMGSAIGRVFVSVPVSGTAHSVLNCGEAVSVTMRL